MADKKTIVITRRDFISGPYKKCPNPQCSGEDTFGVFTTLVGSSDYSRECIKCGYQEDFSLPRIKKKVLYLDQFVISNLIKLLDTSHPSHNKVKADPFWESLFIKLEAASKSQAIVCPDSFYHREESLTGKIDHKLMKRLYEHFSSGKTLYPSSVIQNNQISQHFNGWISNEKVDFGFKPEDIAFEKDLHTWSVGLMVSVGGNPYPGEIEGLKTMNVATKEQLEAIWARWQSETKFGFVERIKQEALGVGKGLIGASKQFSDKRTLAMKKMAMGEEYTFDLNDFLPPICIDLFKSIMENAQAKGVPEIDVPETIIRYFNDVDSLLEIPQLRIASIMYAGLARRAALGKKNPPKSTADVQFISSYLPYCDALFVDKESASLLKELPKNTPSHLRLKEFPAKVFSLNDKDKFLDYLDQIVNEIPKDQIDILKDVSGEDYGKPYWNIIENEKDRTK